MLSVQVVRRSRECSSLADYVVPLPPRAPPPGVPAPPPRPTRPAVPPNAPAPAPAPVKRRSASESRIYATPLPVPAVRPVQPTIEEDTGDYVVLLSQPKMGSSLPAALALAIPPHASHPSSGPQASVPSLAAPPPATGAASPSLGRLSFGFIAHGFRSRDKPPLPPRVRDFAFSSLVFFFLLLHNSYGSLDVILYLPPAIRYVYHGSPNGSCMRSFRHALRPQKATALLPSA
jgi:hypothetical protein